MIMLIVLGQVIYLLNIIYGLLKKRNKTSV